MVMVKCFQNMKERGFGNRDERGSVRRRTDTLTN
jgi:hypothetical protein